MKTAAALAAVAAAACVSFVVGARIGSVTTAVGLQAWARQARAADLAATHQAVDTPEVGE